MTFPDKQRLLARAKQHQRKGEAGKAIRLYGLAAEVKTVRFGEARCVDDRP